MDESSRGGREPELLPCLMFSRGRVMLPGEDGPVIARGADDRPIDPLDAADRLASKYPRVYVVDLDGIERDRPQLDYLQELSRGVEIWADTGCRVGDQAIDTIVAGARRAVLSTAHLESVKDVRRAWRVTPEVMLEVELRDGRTVGRSGEWNGVPAPDAARAGRAIAPLPVVLSPRDRDPDWAEVARVSAEGETWVAGTFTPTERDRLRPAGAFGGIFHIASELEGFEAPAETLRAAPSHSSSGSRRAG